MSKLSDALLSSPKVEKTRPGPGGPTWPGAVHDCFDSLWAESKMPKSACPECDKGPWDLDLILSHLVDAHDYENAQLAEFVTGSESSIEVPRKEKTKKPKAKASETGN